MLLEEVVDQAADGRHGRPPLDIGAANRSNRWLAASMRSAVIVKYTAVETGSTCPRNVESFMRLSAGLPPSRYHRSRRPTAKLCLRSWTCGGVPPAGVATFSCGTREWNTMLIVPGFTGRPSMNENTGVSGDITGIRSALMFMKP